MRYCYLGDGEYAGPLQGERPFEEVMVQVVALRDLAARLSQLELRWDGDDKLVDLHTALETFQSWKLAIEQANLGFEATRKDPDKICAQYAG